MIFFPVIGVLLFIVNEFKDYFSHFIVFLGLMIVYPSFFVQGTHDWNADVNPICS